MTWVISVSGLAGKRQFSASVPVTGQNLPNVLSLGSNLCAFALGQLVE
jgi:hypothetical protein